MTLTAEQAIDPQTQEDLPWLVIVLDDSHNSFQGVAAALAEVLPGVDYDEGLRLASKIDRDGSGIVWSGMKEPAELYWSELGARGLTMAPLSQ